MGRDSQGNISVGFLPRRLLWLNDIENFEWRGKTMYTGKLADIFAMAHSKYLKNKKRFQLHSETMKSMFGNGYARYIGYLEDLGIMVKVRRYYNGSHCNTYTFADELDLVELSGGMLVERPTVSHAVGSTPHPRSIQRQLQDDLNRSQLNHVGAQRWYEQALKDGVVNKDSYVSGMYAIRHFSSKYMVFDGYGRVHSNITNLKKEIRREYLTLDGMPTREIDIANSQPLFMSNIMSREGTYDERFFRDCANGVIYDKLALSVGSSRTEAKNMAYKVMFGPNRAVPKHNTPDWHFDNLYPTAYRWIRGYKIRHGNYKVLSREMQRTESDFVFNRLVPGIKAVSDGSPVLTVHDSIIVMLEHYTKSMVVFDAMLQELKEDILVLELF